LRMRSREDVAVEGIQKNAGIPNGISSIF